MTEQKILLPYNFTAYDKKALDFVICTFSNRKDVEITLFNAYTPVPEIDVRGSPVMEKLQHNLTYLSQKIKEHEAALKAAQQTLIQNGFSGLQVKIIFKPRQKDIAGELIDLVWKDQYNVMVIHHKPGKVTRFFTKSIFYKVVNSLKDTTVCIVS